MDPQFAKTNITPKDYLGGLLGVDAQLWQIRAAPLPVPLSAADVEISSLTTKRWLWLALLK